MVMPDWFDLLQNAIKSDHKAVLVTVVNVAGSAPREAGASLVVTNTKTTGTIGGGNLELRCIAQARELLAAKPVRNCKQIALGPSLGQCCGGRVEILFDVVTPDTDWFIELTASHNTNDNLWLCRSVNSADAVVATESKLKQRLPADTVDSKDGLHASFLVTHGDYRWCYQSLRVNRPQVMVYGAGHVGQAVVTQLSLLDCLVTLLDSREEWLYLQPDLKISRVLTDTPDEDAVNTPDEVAHVIMTHSHSVDFDICHALLKKGKFSWLGLIGSETKRQTFINRLQPRGVSELEISRLRCPIGCLQVESSRPELISLNLAAELALHWQQTGKIKSDGHVH